VGWRDLEQKERSREFWWWFGEKSGKAKKLLRKENGVHALINEGTGRDQSGKLQVGGK